MACVFRRGNQVLEGASCFSIDKAVVPSEVHAGNQEVKVESPGEVQNGRIVEAESIFAKVFIVRLKGERKGGHVCAEWIKKLITDTNHVKYLSSSFLFD